MRQPATRLRVSDLIRSAIMRAFFVAVLALRDAEAWVSTGQVLNLGARRIWRSGEGAKGSSAIDPRGWGSKLVSSGRKTHLGTGARCHLWEMVLGEEKHRRARDLSRSVVRAKGVNPGRAPDSLNNRVQQPYVARAGGLVNQGLHSSGAVAAAGSFPQLLQFDDAGDMLEAISPFLTPDEKGRFPITG